MTTIGMSDILAYYDSNQSIETVTGLKAHAPTAGLANKAKPSVSVQ
jgi:hypothetical protein